ncbi:MAG TPA: YceI family protein [Steroidobacteraceae bacterium]|nr:YceI family protein [Steroidobacteraceae bacterium]
MRGLFYATVVLASAGVTASPVTYTIDPDHTHPAFEADHLDGLSVWRGIFRTTHGRITLDRAAQSGSVQIEVEVASVDFGNEQLNETAAHASAPPIFEAQRYPTARYEGKLTQFVRGVPTRVTGTLEMHGVSRPLQLKIDSFKCLQHPLRKREVCGADASGTLNRADFGIKVGQGYGFRMGVRLHIQVEAIRAG